MSSRTITWGVVTVLAALFIYWQYTNYAHNSYLITSLGARYHRSAQVAAVTELINKKEIGDILPTTSSYVHYYVLDALQQVARNTSKKDLSTEAINQMVAMLSYSDGGVRRKAQSLLAALGPIAINGVITGLGNPDVHARTGAVSILTKIGPAAVPALVAAVQTNPAQRSAAVDALVSLSPAPTPDMLKLLDNKDKDVRSAAATYFGNTALVPGHKQTIACDKLLALLNDKDTREAAMRAEGLLGDIRALPETLKALTAPADAGNRRTAIVALGNMKAISAVPDLVPFLHDDDPDVQSVTVLSLHTMGAGVVPELTKAYAAANGPSQALIRRNIAEALAGNMDPSSIAFLSRILHDPDATVRQAAATSLGDPNNAAAVAPLIAMFRDPSPDVAEAADASLGQIGDPAIAPLIKVLGSAQSESTQKGITSGVMPTIVAPYYASKALVLIGSDAADAVIKAAQSGSLAARTWALVTLADLRVPKAEPVLQSLASNAPGDLKWFAEDALRRYHS